MACRIGISGVSYFLRNYINRLEKLLMNIIIKTKDKNILIKVRNGKEWQKTEI